MAGFGDIPLKAGFTSMGELAELMLKKRALQAEAPLQQAKAREANMLANMYAVASGMPIPQEEKPEPSMLQKIMAMFHGEEQPKAPANQSMGQGAPQGMNQPNNYNPENKLTPEGQQNASSALQQNGSYVLRPEDIAADKMNRQQLVDRANKDSDFLQRNQGVQTPSNAPMQNQPNGSLGGLPNTPEAIRARDMLIARGLWKESPIEQEAREVRTSLAKEKNKSLVKKQDEIETTIENATDSKETLDAIEEIVTSPVYESMKQNPILMGKDMSWYKIQGNKGQQQLAGSLESTTGKVYADMAKNFKGQFRVGEQSLVKNMKVNPEDSMDVALGKLKALQGMNDLLLKRSKVVSKLMNQGYSKLDAIEEADKLVNGKEVRTGISKRIDDAISRNKKNEKSKNYVVMNKNGQTYHIPKLEALAAERAGYKLS